MVYLKVVVSLIAVSFFVALTNAGTDSLAARSPEEGEEKVVHDVYFSLKDSSSGARGSLVAACHKYLKDHPGVVFFAAGTRAEDFKREVNDLSFDVSLHIVFQTKTDHDRYQVNDRHQQFIRENQGNWARVRVFDSYVK
jgi:hypothetical protein